MRNTVPTLLCCESGAAHPPRFSKSVVLIGWILLAHAALAQQVVAPTPDQAGSPRGENTGDYNVMESFETGYRFAVVDGSVGTYRLSLIHI